MKVYAETFFDYLTNLNAVNHPSLEGVALKDARANQPAEFLHQLGVFDPQN